MTTDKFGLVETTDKPVKLTVRTNGALVRLLIAEQCPYRRADVILTRAEARELVGKIEDVLVTGETAEMEVAP